MRIAELSCLASIALTVAVVSAVSAQPGVAGDSRPVISQNEGIQKFDQQFLAQSVDSSWAPVIESALNDILASIDIESTERDIECRTSMCRLVLGHPFDTPPPDFSSVLSALHKELRTVIEQDSRLKSVTMNSTIGQSPDRNWITRIYLGSGE